MHVLVTGGAGFIGSHTVERLLEIGAKVRVLDNLSTGKQCNLPRHQDLDLHIGDIRDLDALSGALAKVTHVLHLAAQVSVQASVDNPVSSCSANILGFVTVLNAARTHHVQRVVYASSAAVYGHPESLPLTERSPVGPVSPYGLEKSVNDQYASLFHKLFGLSSLGLRYFNVYGPRQDPCSPYAGVISKFQAWAEQGQPLRVNGDGRQSRDFIFVKDVAEANVRALSSECVGVCNVATGKSWTVLEMIQALGECVGRPLDVIHQSAQPGDIPHSSAEVERLGTMLGLTQFVGLQEGLGQLIGERMSMAHR